MFHGECAHAAGTGQIIVNNRPIEKFFTQETQRIAVSSALTFVKLATAFDIICSVEGGGLTGRLSSAAGSAARAEAGDVVDQAVPALDVEGWTS